MKFNQLLSIIFMIIISNVISLELERSKKRNNKKDGNLSNTVSQSLQPSNNSNSEQIQQPLIENTLTNTSSEKPLNNTPNSSSQIEAVSNTLKDNTPPKVIDGSTTNSETKKEINESEFTLFDEINKFQIELIKSLTLVYQKLDSAMCMIDKLSGYEQFFIEMKEEDILKESASNFKSRKTYVQTISQFNEFVTKFKNEKLIEFINTLKTAPLLKHDNSSLKAIQAEGTQSVLAVYNGIKNSFRVVAKRIAEMSKNKVTIENNC